MKKIVVSIFLYLLPLIVFSAPPRRGYEEDDSGGWFIMLVMWTLVIVVGGISLAAQKTKEVYRKAVPYSGKKLEQVLRDEYYKLELKALK